MAIVGGTISEVTGGKFANGAVTSAMAFAFNELPSSNSKNLLERLRETEVIVVGDPIELSVLYDPREIARILKLQVSLAEAQGEDFFTAEYLTAERSMLLRIILGYGDKYTVGFYAHENAEAALLESWGSFETTLKTDSSRAIFREAQQDAHRRVIFEQGHQTLPRQGLYERYHPDILERTGG